MGRERARRGPGSRHTYEVDDVGARKRLAARLLDYAVGQLSDALQHGGARGVSACGSAAPRVAVDGAPLAMWPKPLLALALAGWPC